MKQVTLLLGDMGPVVGLIDPDAAKKDPVFTREQLQYLEDTKIIRNLRFTPPKFVARFEIFDPEANTYVDVGARMPYKPEGYSSSVYDLGEYELNWDII